MQKDKVLHRAICEDVVFRILQDKSSSFLLNRYKLGRIQAGSLFLNKFECFYLYLKGRVAPENVSLNTLDSLLGKFGADQAFLDTLIVFSIMKDRGLYVKIESGSLFYRRNPRDEYQGPVRVIRESETIEFAEMLNSDGCIYVALDDDNDVTIFISQEWDELGENELPPFKATGLKQFNKIYLVDKSSVPPWFGNLLGEEKLLNQYEANHILGKPLDTLENPFMQAIFDDLARRNFIVKTGFKYGANFRIYARTIEEHADFLVHVIERSEQWYKISRAIRVAQGVRKEMVFAAVVDSEIRYVKFRRVRDPFSISV